MRHPQAFDAEGKKVKRPKDKRLNLPTRMEASLGLPCYAEGKNVRSSQLNQD